MHTWLGRGEANRAPEVWEESGRERRASRNPPQSTNREKKSLSDQNTNIPKRKAAENKEGLW